MQKTKIKRIFVGCLAIGLLIGGYFVLQPVVGDWIKTAEGETTAPAKTPTVTVAKPLTMMIVEWDEYIGRMEAVESVDIRSRVSGYLEGYFFEEGDVVKAGDRLFQIDPRPFQAVLSEAKGALAEAESAVVEARALEAQSQAQREQVAAQVDLAAIRLKRNRRLIKQSAVSQDEYDAAKSALRQANADLAASEAVIASAKARTITAQATVRSATATLQTAELNLSFTNIHAPISGRIGRRLATNGNLIAGGTTGGADSSVTVRGKSRTQFTCRWSTKTDFRIAVTWTSLTTESTPAPGRFVAARFSPTQTKFSHRECLPNCDCPGAGATKLR